MKSRLLWNAKNFVKTTKFLYVQFRYVANSVKKSQPETAEKEEQFNKHTKKKLYSKTLEKETVQKLSSITSITVEMNYISWAKIELPNLRLANWDSYSIPTELSSELQDLATLKAAHSLRQLIPKSDLYVLESNTFKHKPHFNGSSLRSMIIFFLSELDDGSLEKNKLFFQRPFIVNCLYYLTVGGERTSAKAIIESKILKDLLGDELNNTISDAFSLVDIKREQLFDFAHHVIEKQESLCLALLIALSFLDIIYLETPESISKLQERAASSQMKVTDK